MNTELEFYEPDPVDVLAEAVDAGGRCIAATGTPVDRTRRCIVHGDGSHHCYQGPGHQAAKVVSPAVFVPASGCHHNLPEWATHICDCGFRWANVVQASE